MNNVKTLPNICPEWLDGKNINELQITSRKATMHGVTRPLSRTNRATKNIDNSLGNWYHNHAFTHAQDKATLESDLSGT